MSTAESLRALLVDDEPVARLALRRRLEQVTTEVAVCGEASSGGQALQLARQLTPDLVFLDIAMPDMSGLDVARRLEGDPPPIVVFLTAFGDRAVEAFETCALDYLMKPVSPERLTRTLQRVRQELAQRRELQLAARLKSVVRQFETPEQLSAASSNAPLQPIDQDPSAAQDLPVKLDVGDGFVFLDEREIEFIETAGDYACVHARGETHIVRESLKSLSERCLSQRFFRINRQVLVNLDRISRLERRSGSDSCAYLADGRELMVSRRRMVALRRLMGG